MKGGKPGAGENLRREREKAGMTQEGLAAALGVTRQTVHCWESGKHAIKLETALKAAKALGIPPLRLVEEDDEEKVTGCSRP